MNIFIRAASSISPQNTFGQVPFLEALTIHEGNSMRCIEPDYKNFIDPKLIRRMSRIIKMGSAAAMQCLKEAAVEMPDAIITGTAYGCLEDTGVFLTKMVEQKEELLTPTAFIQSTHNTVAAQIALSLHCHNYNNTFVHRGFSFESALLDAMTMMKDDEVADVLVGGTDEITAISQKILSRFGLYKKENVTNEKLFLTSTAGTIAGEGASFFLLSNKASENNLAKLDALKTFYKPSDEAAIQEQIQLFLKEETIDINEIDLIITGRNGDKKNDAIYEVLSKTSFKGVEQINFKQFCGEYPTAIAFGLYVAANIIKQDKLPQSISEPKKQTGFKKILLYNHYLGIHHSLFLISAC